ncbi:MAG: ribonuclease HII [Pseudomonadota bacterium]
MTPTFQFEQFLLDRGHRLIAGVDEVGRGPLAGPVYAAAVILDPAHIPGGLNDSKALTAKRRHAVMEDITKMAHIGIGYATVFEIDQINILRASHLAMVRALDALPLRPDIALIDGNQIPRDCPIPAQPIVKGDAKSLSIAAASIVAKIRRDYVMKKLAQEFPRYGWDTNMGYPTKMHKKALQDLGVTPHHRRSFAPVRNML